MSGQRLITGIFYPRKQGTVNLAPASVRKESTVCLPIHLGRITPNILQFC